MRELSLAALVVVDGALEGSRPLRYRLLFCVWLPPTAEEPRADLAARSRGRRWASRSSASDAGAAGS